jgi:hypothetical protein
VSAEPADQCGGRHSGDNYEKGTLLNFPDA